MGRFACKLAAASLLLWLASCSRSGPARPSTVSAASPAAAEPAARREIRLSGVVIAVNSVKVAVPSIQGQYSRMGLTSLIPNGSRVKAGDVIATFDPAQQMDAARDAKAKFEDLGHQVDQKIAENRANAEKRAVDMRQAQADQQKAELELKKGPVLSSIAKQQAEARAEGARVHVESLKKSQVFREKSEAAALRILELQRDRQKINMQRAQDNIAKLELRAPIDGSVVHEVTYRGNSYGHAQVGDQIYRSYPLVSIFEPSVMQVRCNVNEPDVLALLSQGSATVRLDAYPDLPLSAHFLNASPVATSGLGTPVKSFTAIFQIDHPDSHILPDLSASVSVALPSRNREGAVSKGGVK